MKRKIINIIAAVLFVVGLYCFFGLTHEIGLACVNLGNENCAKAIAE